MAEDLPNRGPGANSFRSTATHWWVARLHRRTCLTDSLASMDRQVGSCAIGSFAGFARSLEYNWCWYDRTASILIQDPYCFRPSFTMTEPCPYVHGRSDVLCWVVCVNRCWPTLLVSPTRRNVVIYEVLGSRDPITKLDTGRAGSRAADNALMNGLFQQGTSPPTGYQSHRHHLVDS